jgi:hypothetical protein
MSDHALATAAEDGPLSDLVHPRSISAADAARFEQYLAEIFTALVLDLNTPSTAPTPRRHLRAPYDVTIGYEGDPKTLTGVVRDRIGVFDPHGSPFPRHRGLDRRALVPPATPGPAVAG